MTKYEYWQSMEAKAVQKARQFVDDRHLYSFYINAAVEFHRRQKNATIAEAEEVVK